MPDDTPQRTDRQVWGLAVKALRRRKGKTIYEVAQAYEPEGYTPGDPKKGISVQRWGQIEKGQFAFTDDQQKRLARAAGGGLDELRAERARILGHTERGAAAAAIERTATPAGLGVPIFGRTEFLTDGWKVTHADVAETGFNLTELMGPSVGGVYMPDDAMAPVRAGALILFDRSRRPKLEQGCVLETHDGELIPRLYVSDSAEEVVVRARKAAEPEHYPRDQVKGVYAVRFWED